MHRLNLLALNYSMFNSNLIFLDHLVTFRPVSIKRNKYQLFPEGDIKSEFIGTDIRRLPNISRTRPEQCPQPKECFVATSYVFQPSYTCQLFLTPRRMIFILGVQDFRRRQDYIRRLQKKSSRVILKLVLKKMTFRNHRFRE